MITLADQNLNHHNLENPMQTVTQLRGRLYTHLHENNRGMWYAGSLTGLLMAMAMSYVATTSYLQVNKYDDLSDNKLIKYTCIGFNVIAVSVGAASLKIIYRTYNFTINRPWI